MLSIVNAAFAHRVPARAAGTTIRRGRR